MGAINWILCQMKRTLAVDNLALVINNASLIWAYLQWAIEKAWQSTVQPPECVLRLIEGDDLGQVLLQAGDDQVDALDVTGHLTQTIQATLHSTHRRLLRCTRLVCARTKTLRVRIASRKNDMNGWVRKKGQNRLVGSPPFASAQTRYTLIRENFRLAATCAIPGRPTSNLLFRLANKNS